MPLTVQQLRAAAGGLQNLTDEQVVQASYEFYKPYYPKFEEFASAVGYDPEDDFVRGAKIAGRNTLAAGAGAVAAGADALGFTGARDSALSYGRRQAGLARQMGRRSDDVDNFAEDPLSFISSAAGQAVTYAVPSLVAGAVTGGVGTAAGLGLAGRVAATGAGAYGANLVQETGGIYNDLAEQGKYEPGRALAYGAGAAALDTVPEMMGVGRVLRPALGGRLRNAATGAVAGAGVEAGTEVAQTAIERAGAYHELTGADAMRDYRNAAALGGVGGGMFGGATGALRRPAAAPAADPAAPKDLLREEPGFQLESYGQGDGPLRAPIQAEQLTTAPTPTPGQYDLFLPDGTPTYGADNYGDGLDKPVMLGRAPRTGLRMAAVEQAPTEALPLELPQEVQGQLYRAIADKADAGLPLTPTEEQILDTYSSTPRQYVAPGPIEMPVQRRGFELSGNPTPQFYAPPPVERPEFELTSPDTSQMELDLQAPEQAPIQPAAPLRPNQRGFVNELPFVPPEAKINTPVGRQLYGLADSLVQEGFMDEADMDQVTTMLTQSMIAKASKVVNKALADKKAAQATFAKAEKQSLDEQQKALDVKSVSQQTNTAVTMEADNPPERVYAAKVDKYERLLACLKG